MFSRRGNWVPFRPTGENWSSEQSCIRALLYEMNTEELEAKGENFIDNLQKVSRHLNKRAVYIINLEELIFCYSNLSNQQQLRQIFFFFLPQPPAPPASTLQAPNSNAFSLSRN